MACRGEGSERGSLSQAIDHDLIHATPLFSVQAGFGCLSRLGANRKVPSHVRSKEVKYSDGAVAFLMD